MAILKKSTILKESDWKRVDDYFKQNPNLTAFASYPTMEMYLNSAIKAVHLTDTADGLRFISKSKGAVRDIRILYDKKPHDGELAEQLIEEEQPHHIGFEHISNPRASAWEDLLPIPELVQNLGDIVQMKGNLFKNVRREYNNAQKKYSGLDLVSEANSVKHSGAMRDFFTEWVKNKNEENVRRGMPPAYDGIFDFEFIDELLGKKGIWGTMIFDKERLAAVEFTTYCPSDEKFCFGFMKKNLQQYPGLGTYLKVEAAKKYIEKGFEKNNTGPWFTEEGHLYKKKFQGHEPYLYFYNETYYTPCDLAWTRSF